MHRCAAFVLAVSLTIASSVRTQPTVSQSKPLLLAHFMPWYVAPPVASEWGWHWTMNHFDPNVTEANGKREIASHYYPLTGPYDSMDGDILEYQVLLMKLSGIDGILVDWYGIGALWDYPVINERTNAAFDYIRKAGLQFAIVYEDQTITHMISQNVLQETDKYRHAQETMRYLEETWFKTAEYVKIEDQPVLLTFGPQHFEDSAEWENIFSVLSVQPLFFTLDNRLAPAVGAFSWPPMWKTSANGTLSQASLREYLVQFSATSAAWPFRVSSAFPAFHDIYQEAGVSDGYGYLDPGDGSTFALTLERALSDAPQIIQLVTWNDYGEGTIIEPTEETGYRYLDMVQNFKRSAIDSTFQPQPEHLQLPLQLYTLRRQHANDRKINDTLDRVFELFVDMKLDSAHKVLDILERGENPDEKASPEFGLKNHPNPFSARTTITYHVSSSSYVTIRVYNCAGQCVAELVNAHQDAGEHAVLWEAGDVSAGIYFYRYDEMAQKCLLLK
ncbi:T9SS type A sorting domain-containing protein [candidate division KSB1 bacterium]|nr:T9SS type A sorting domain-containing protein [candidate division KSB1 bacterium]RQW06444.1 MAG: T9SS C-terminal target domain-containing protein [candidate division KSB1 bacterium]